MHRPSPAARPSRRSRAVGTAVAASLLAGLLVALHPAPPVVAAEVLEVTTFADSGPGSLRQAIATANATPGRDRIELVATQQVQPTAALPSITDPVDLTGTTGPGRQNHITAGLGSIPVGLHFAAGSEGSTVSDLTVSAFAAADIDVDVAPLRLEGVRVSSHFDNIPGFSATGIDVDAAGAVEIVGGADDREMGAGRSLDVGDGATITATGWSARKGLDVRAGGTLALVDSDLEVPDGPTVRVADGGTLASLAGTRLAGPHPQVEWEGSDGRVVELAEGDAGEVEVVVEGAPFADVSIDVFAAPADCGAIEHRDTVDVTLDEAGRAEFAHAVGAERAVAVTRGGTSISSCVAVADEEPRLDLALDVTGPTSVPGTLAGFRAEVANVGDAAVEAGAQLSLFLDRVSAAEVTVSGGEATCGTSPSGDNGDQLQVTCTLGPIAQGATLTVDLLTTTTSAGASAGGRVTLAGDVEAGNDSDGATAPEPALGAFPETATVAEDAGTLRLEAVLDRAPPGPMSFDVALTDGSATAGDDVTLTTTRIDVDEETERLVVDLTVVDDDAVEADEDLTVTLFGEGNTVLLGNATTSVTVVDDDTDVDPPDPDGAAAAVDAALDAVAADLPGWLGAFALDGPLPVVPADLAALYDLDGLADDLDLPTVDPATATADALADALEAQGCTVDHVVGGAGGRPAPAAPGDVIQVRCARTLADLDAAPGGPDAFADDTPGLLDRLLAAADLDAEGTWGADLGLTLVVGVDADGAYVLGASGARLDVAGSLAVAGEGQRDGAVAVSGTAAAALGVAVSLGSADDRVRLAEVGGPLTVAVAGTAAVDVALAVPGLDLTWAGDWTVAGGDPPDVTTHQALSGVLDLPALTGPDGDPARLAVTGVLTPAGWAVTGEGDLGVGSELAGLEVDDLVVDLLLGDDGTTGEVSAVVRVTLDGETVAVPVTVTFAGDEVTVDGSVALDDLDLGLVTIDGAELRVHLVGDVGAATLGGTVTVDGDPGGTLVLLPDGDGGGAATATGFTATVSLDGDLTITADAVTASVLDGAILLDVGAVTVSLGPGATGPLLTADPVTGRFPGLGDLGITVEDLVLSRDGRFGASAVVVDTRQVAETIGLGGILPFDLDGLSVDFPDPSDLSRFDTTVSGRFDLSAFAGLGFTPVVGLGDRRITPTTPPDDARFTFSARVDGGVVRPLDVDDITLGFDDLDVGPVTLGADLTLGGVVGGVPAGTVGGAVRVESGLDGVVGSLEAAILGTIEVDGDRTVLAVEGSVTVDASLGAAPPISVEGLRLRYGLTIALEDGEVTVEPTVRGLDVDRLTIPVADLFTFTASDATFDLAPAPGEPIATFGAGGLSLAFADVPVLAGWEGTVSHVAIGADLVPTPLDGFGIDVDPPDDLDLGFPAFLPFAIDEVGFALDDVQPGDPLDLSGVLLRFSGGLQVLKGEGGAPLFPVTAQVQGLEVDLGLLVAGQMPITNLEGVSFGVAPFTLGGMTIGGGAEIGTVEVGDDAVFYVRVTGTFAAGGLGAGIDVVISERGPVLAEVSAPLGIPLGPTGIVLAGVSGGIKFGGTVLPPVDPLDPGALLTYPLFQELGDFEVTEETIAEVIGRLGDGFGFASPMTLQLTGTFTHVAAPIVEGQVTLGANLGGGAVDLLGKGELTAMGLPLGQVGLRGAFSDPVNPAFQLAFASPPPGSPLGAVLPARINAAAALDTTGLAQGTVRAARAFVDAIVAGTLTEGAALVGAAVDRLATGLDADRRASVAPGLPRPLTLAVLDTASPRGTLSAAERNRTITRAFLLSRLQTLLTGDAGALARDLLVELTASAADPEASAEDLAEIGAEIFGAALSVFRQAIRAAGAAFLAVADPVLTVEGSLQPTILGIPLGDPTDEVELVVRKEGIDLRLTTSISGIVNRVADGSTGGAFRAMTGNLTHILTDEVTVVANLPLAGLLEGLIAGDGFPTFDPSATAWGVTIEGAAKVFGMRVAEVSGLLVPPGNRAFVTARTQRLYEPGAVFDPSDASRPVPVLTSQQFEALVASGGLVLTGNLSAPELLTDPLAVLADLDLEPPEDPLAIPDWLAGLGEAASRTISPGFVQLYLPPPVPAARPHLVGQWDAKVLSVPITRGSFALDETGLRVDGGLPLAGLTGTLRIQPPTTVAGDDGAFALPRASLTLGLSRDDANRALADLGLRAPIQVPAGNSAEVRAYTPGFDPESEDPLEREGGFAVEATLSIPRVVSRIAVDLRLTAGGGFSGAASVDDLALGPVTVDTLEVTVAGRLGQPGSATVDLFGAGTVFGATVEVDGALGADGTGSIVLDVDDLDIGGFVVGATFSLVWSSTAIRFAVDDGTVRIPGTSRDVGVEGSFDSNGRGELQVTIDGNLRFEGTGFSVRGAIALARRREGGVTVTRFTGQDMTFAWAGVGDFTVSLLEVASDGSAAFAVPARAITLPGDAVLSLGALAFAMDAGGEDPRLSMGETRLAIPGIAENPSGPADHRFTIPAFTVRDSDFTRVLVDGSYTLGAFTFSGKLTVAKAGDVWTVALERTTNPTRPPRVAFAGLVLDLPTVTISSDGTFDVDAEDLVLGPSALQIRADRVRLRKTGAGLDTLQLRITGGEIRVPVGDPIVLGETLVIGSGASFTQDVEDVGVDLGPLLTIDEADYRVALADGVWSLKLIDRPGSANTPSVTTLGGSAIELTKLDLRSSGTFDLDLEGQLSVFGVLLGSATFDVDLDDGVLDVQMGAATSANLGFITAQVDGSFDSTGAFSFSGSGSVKLPTDGCESAVGAEATLTVTLSSTSGINGSGSLSICALGGKGTATGSMDSRGVVTGSVVLKAFGRTVFSGGFTVELRPRILRLRAGGEQIFAIDFDGGSGTSGADTTRPVFVPTPVPNQTVVVDVPPSGTVPVEYVLPGVQDPPDNPSGSRVVRVCSPAPGSPLGVGAHTVSCTATDAAGLRRTASFTVAVEDSTPGSAFFGELFQGGTASMGASGFVPRSDVVFEVRSEPIVLDHYTADARGEVWAEAPLPADLEPGLHSLVLHGEAPDGSLRVVQVRIRVLAAPPAGPPPPAGGGVAAGPVGPLPRTGSDPAPLVALAGALLALGALGVGVRRRAA